MNTATHTIEVKTLGRVMTILIAFYESGLSISTVLDGRKRTHHYESVESALLETSLVPAIEYLKSL